MINNFKAIIFDMDGVFIDTETLVFDIFRHVFEPFNIDLSNEYQYKFIGKPFSSNLIDIHSDFGIEFDDAALRDKFDDVYEEMLTASPLSVQAGVKDIIKNAQQNDQKLALCTTSTRHHVNAVFTKVREKFFDPDQIFGVVTTGDMVRHRKPHPEPYLKTVDKLGVAPKDCLVLEDSITGIQSAKAAGCFCVGLRQPYNQHINFDAADIIVSHLDQVL